MSSLYLNVFPLCNKTLIYEAVLDQERSVFKIVTEDPQGSI